MKVFVLAPNENWIVDRFVKEFNEFNPDIATTNPQEADILWLLADWCWRQVPEYLLRTKKVICSSHHVVPEKFGPQQQIEFEYRDQFVDLYHSMCQITDDFLKPYMTKPSFVQNFWANQNLWVKLDPYEPWEHRMSIDEKMKFFGVNEPKHFIGSFQRDTEGGDLISPKLEKGPDIFCDFVEQYNNIHDNVHVVLAGWRRQYVISRLKNAGIPYSYFEWADFQTLNKLYNHLDLYVVSSRHEGGPQAIVECALTETPVISTRVGTASIILHPDSIASDFTAEALMQCQPNVSYAKDSVRCYKIPAGFARFRLELQKVLK